MSSPSDCISTGRLPDPRQARALVREAHARFGSNDEGQNADYIPALAEVPRELFGICLGGTSGELL